MGAIQEEHDHENVVNEPVNNAETGDPVVDPMLDEAAEATQDVDAVPEPLDHGIYDELLIGSQYMGIPQKARSIHWRCLKSTPMMVIGEQMMVICEDHLQYDADGAFLVVVEDSDIEPSEPDDSDAIEQ
jgi:hypothetical protein